MKLPAFITKWRDRRNLEYAQEKLEGKPSPFREGAPEKSQAQSVDPTGARFVP